MTFAYFDTSALIKRYVRERGSTRVGSFLLRYDVLSCAITPIEIMSALSRRKRQQELSEKDFAATVGRVQGERVRWELVEVGETVLSRAEEIVRGTIPIRTLDAIQVAAATTFQAATSIRIPFVTGDARQRDSAALLGLDVTWVG